MALSDDQRKNIESIMDSRRQRLADGPFQKLEHSLAHEKGVTNAPALAAGIGRKSLGEKEMARRSAEGRKK